MESNSLTRDQTQGPCIGSTESQPLDHLGSPHTAFREVPELNRFTARKPKQQRQAPFRSIQTTRPACLSIAFSGNLDSVLTSATLRPDTLECAVSGRG